MLIMVKNVQKILIRIYYVAFFTKCLILYTNPYFVEIIILLKFN